jgi:hypothetical protein
MMKIVNFSNPIRQDAICGNEIVRSNSSGITYCEWSIFESVVQWPPSASGFRKKFCKR